MDCSTRRDSEESEVTAEGGIGSQAPGTPLGGRDLISEAECFIDVLET